MEAGAVEQRFLDAGHKSEPRQAASLAQLPQEGQIQHQCLVAPGAEIVEQLVHDEQQAVIRIPLVEGAHHGHQQVFAVGRFAHGGERIGNAHLLQRQLQLTEQDVAQGHGRGPDLGAYGAKLAGDGLDGVSYLLVGERFDQVTMLGYSGQHRHQVRLAGAIVTHDHEPFVVLWLGELQLRDHQAR